MQVTRSGILFSLGFNETFLVVQQAPFHVWLFGWFCWRTPGIKLSLFKEMTIDG